MLAPAPSHPQEEYDRYKTRLDTAKASLEGTKAKLKTANQSINAAAAEVKRTEVRIETPRSSRRSGGVYCTVLPSPRRSFLSVGRYP